MSDAAGNEAMVRRRIYVLNPCPEGEHVCECSAADNVCAITPGATFVGGSYYVCTLNGICMTLEVDFSTEEEKVVDEPPVLRLRGSANVEVDQFQPYVTCSANAPLTALCDRGATASDAEDGNMDNQVQACSSDGKTYYFQQVRGERSVATDTLEVLGPRCSCLQCA